MSKLRVAIIDFVGEKAGMHLYDFNLAMALREKGCLARIYSNFLVDEELTEVVFKRIVKHKLHSAFNLIMGTLSAVRKVKQHQFDFIIVHLFSFELKDLVLLFLMKQFRGKKVLILHDVSGFAKKDKKWIKSLIINRLCDVIVLHNNFSLKVLKRDVKWAIEKKTRIIPHGNFVDSSAIKFDYLTARHKLSLSLSKFYVLFFGQIKKTKGLDILIKAMSQDLPGDIELIIAGKPWHDDFKTYEQQIKHLGIENRVKLKIGFIEDVEKELLLSAVNILVLPYRQIFQSGVALMAMSRNVPIIASDLEPFVEITQQGRLGRLFKSEDHESLKNQILKAYHNPEETSLISKSAFDFVSENYDWNDIASLYVELFQDQDI